jgi:hypothetical protein
MWLDFSEMAKAVTEGAVQLSEGANGATARPLMAKSREYLRLPIKKGGIVEHLCASVRRSARTRDLPGAVSGATITSPSRGIYREEDPSSTPLQQGAYCGSMSRSVLGHS